MFVQWCLKGLNLPSDQAAQAILDQQIGLMCNWWRNVNQISPAEVRARLTTDGVDFHVNHFEDILPGTSEPFSVNSPFISLSAGTVERSAVLRTNLVHRALKTALWFGSEFGRSDTAYVFSCWVVLAPRQAVEIEGVAEEVRDLNTYRRYSDFQTEGEILAKVAVPDNQIEGFERWELHDDYGGTTLIRNPMVYNPRFSSPQVLSNVRGVI
jgi:hypothetical protein